MIRRVALQVLLVFAVLLGVWLVQAAESVKLPLLNGFTLEGEPISFNGNGVVIKRPDNSLANRVHWTNFTQTALKTLAEFPEAKPFAEPLIEEDVKDDPIPQDPKITLVPVTRLDRPDPKAGLGALFASPVSLAVWLLVYLANLYAAYEIARYRNYHPALVCGIAAVAPVIGPAIFLILPTYYEEVIEEEPEDIEPAEPITVQRHSPLVKDPGEETEEAAAPAVPGGPPAPIIYKRPQTTFNRRFFETKLAAFLKVVPGEAERDMVICFTSTRGNYIASRLARVHSNGLALLIKKGDASTEVDLPFSEISEVQIRHQDTAAA